MSLSQLARQGAMQLNRHIKDAVSELNMDANTFTSFRVVVTEPESEHIESDVYVRKPSLLRLCDRGASRVFDHLKYLQGHKFRDVDTAFFRVIHGNLVFPRTQHSADLPCEVHVSRSFSMVEPVRHDGLTIGTVDQCMLCNIVFIYSAMRRMMVCDSQGLGVCAKLHALCVFRLTAEPQFFLERTWVPVSMLCF
jgi:hypothetical protein